MHQGWQPRDPFSEFTPVNPRKTAKQVLEDAGISFAAGSSAIYNPSTSQLIVRNTRDQMELVEAYIESIRTGVEKQIFLTFREFSLDEEQQGKADELGFDWLVGKPDDASMPTEGLRRSLNSYQSFLQELSRPPVIADETSPVVRGIAGVFTDPQYQLAVRALEKEFPSGMESLPSVMVRSGQPGLIQVGERRYGAIALLGADEFTIDLSVFLPEHGKAMFLPGDDLSTPLELTIWDGQVVAFTVSSEQGNRTVFVKAQIMDPAGMPINPEGGLEAENTRKKESEETATNFVPELSETDKLKIKEADEIALSGSQQIAAGRHREGAENYRLALEKLPGGEFAEPRRKAYVKQLERAKAALESAEEEEAIEDLDVNATIESRQETWRASLPGGSSHLVRKGQTLYGIATDADTSVSEIRELNRLDSDYIEEGQLILVPGGLNGVPGLKSILKSTIIPSVEFEDATLAEALGFVHRVLLSETGDGLFPTPVPKLILKDLDNLASTRITLRLSNVPMSETLRYITQLAQCRYEVEGTRIVISPLE
ncbi:MAG: LysM peptidoglycan-binding domain-containing protein [Verrucomicrobiota bacterium]